MRLPSKSLIWSRGCTHGPWRVVQFLQLVVPLIPQKRKFCFHSDESHDCVVWLENVQFDLEMACTQESFNSVSLAARTEVPSKIFKQTNSAKKLVWTPSLYKNISIRFIVCAIFSKNDGFSPLYNCGKKRLTFLLDTLTRTRFYMRLLLGTFWLSNRVDSLALKATAMSEQKLECWREPEQQSLNWKSL